MQSMREELSYFIDHFICVKSQLLKFLQRNNEKEQRAVSFVQEFNNIHGDIRTEPEVQGEWMLRCEELQDELRTLCDEKTTETEKQLTEIFGDGFKDENLQKIEQIHVQLLQTEINK